MAVRALPRASPGAGGEMDLVRANRWLIRLGLPARSLGRRDGARGGVTVTRGATRAVDLHVPVDVQLGVRPGHAGGNPWGHGGDHACVAGSTVRGWHVASSRRKRVAGGAARRLRPVHNGPLRRSVGRAPHGVPPRRRAVAIGVCTRLLDCIVGSALCDWPPVEIVDAIHVRRHGGIPRRHRRNGVALATSVRFVPRTALQVDLVCAHARDRGVVVAVQIRGRCWIGGATVTGGTSLRPLPRGACVTCRPRSTRSTSAARSPPIATHAARSAKTG